MINQPPVTELVYIITAVYRKAVPGAQILGKGAVFVCLD